MSEVFGPTFTSLVSGPTITTNPATGSTFKIDEVPGPMSLHQPSCLRSLNQPSPLRSLDQPSHLTTPLGHPSQLTGCLCQCLWIDLMSEVTRSTFTTDQVTGSTFTIDEHPG